MTELNRSDCLAAAPSATISKSPSFFLGLLPFLFFIAGLIVWLVPAAAVRADEGLGMLREGPALMESTIGVTPQGRISLVESRNQMIVLTDKGIDAPNLQMRVADSALFVLNKTSDSLLTIEIAFGKKTTHCASTNLTIGDDGVIRSTKPFAPKDFASVCFHDPGQYPYKVYGLKGKADTISGVITVQ